MAIEVTPLDATLGAIVTGVDLAKLDDGTWEEIHGAFLAYGLLVFPAQHNLDDESQGAFALRFGKTEQLYPKQASPIREVFQPEGRRHARRSPGSSNTKCSRATRVGIRTARTCRWLPRPGC